jgi:hypothetical protein
MSTDAITALTQRYDALWRLWRAPEPGSPFDWHAAGIWDPDADTCVNHHYSLSHLMLAAGLLYELTGDERYGRDRDAMAELGAMHQSARYRGCEADAVHWDFNNFAWLNCALLPHAGRVATLVHEPAMAAFGIENGTLAGNWLTMRQVNRTLRRSLGLPNRSRRLLPERLLWPRIFRSDGGIDEFRDRSRPVQYHAYVLALVMRRFLATGSLSDTDERRLCAGTEFLLSHFDGAGNANYRGRGQYQLFFEGCARYILALMAAWHGREAGGRACEQALASMDSCPWPERSHGLLALNRTDPAPEQTGAQYDYHFPTVYNAFDLAWRLLAEHDLKRICELRPPRTPAPVVRTGAFAVSGIWLQRIGSWLVAVTSGEDMYLSDVGPTFCHLASPRGVLYTAPGGPHPSRYGQLHGSDALRSNIFAPLAIASDGGGVPHFLRGRMHGSDQDVRVSARWHQWTVARRVSLSGARLTIEDALSTPGEATLRHIFHWAAPAALQLNSIGAGAYVAGYEGSAPLAQIAFADGRDVGLRSGEVFRGPGGMVRPWYIDADGPNDRIAFTLELFE